MGNWGVFVIVTVAAQCIVAMIFGWDVVDYADLAESTASIVQNLIIPLLLSTLLVVVAVTVLGWWRSVMRDGLPVPKRMLIVPGLLIAVSLASTDWSRLGEVGTGYTAALVVSALLIGFNEEAMTRGILLTGFSRLDGETAAWAWSTALFALMHGANSFSGSPLSVVLPQVLSAFLTGTLFYLTRRATDALVVAMIAHAVWDFSLFSHGTSKAAVIPGDALLLQSLQSILPIIPFVVVMIAHKHWMDSREPAAV